MVTEASQLKASIRRQLREEGELHPIAERSADSERICRRLRAHAPWQEAGSVLFFAPMEGEPDVWELLLGALRGGKMAALPRYSPQRREYEACRVEDPDREVKAGYFGIREPDQTCRIIAWNSLDFVLVPGVGFSVNGYRLGRGKGYYDRMLARASGVKCGVAFDWQITRDIPVEPHDIRLDCILTPTRWH